MSAERAPGENDSEPGRVAERRQARDLRRHGFPLRYPLGPPPPRKGNGPRARMATGQWRTHTDQLPPPAHPGGGSWSVWVLVVVREREGVGVG